MSATVRDVVDRIDARFPFGRAEPWDNVGLAVGDMAASVTGVFVTLDPTRAAIEAARSCGCNVLATHHPVTLVAHERLLATGASEVLYAAAHADVALIAAHTNLDRAPGAAATLAARLGLEATSRLEHSPQLVDLIVVYVPPQAAQAVRAAMTAAGGGRVGQYEGCSFSAPGTGRFTPDGSARPFAGVPGEASDAQEERIEMVAMRGAGDAVAVAAVAAHPYQEPLVIVSQAQIARGVAAMGCVCDLDGGVLLGELVKRAATAFDCTPRVWGGADTTITRVACATGSAGSLLPDAHASGSQVLVAGEVRYHDALAARASGLAIVELGHDVSEWPLVPLLGEAIASTPGLGENNVHVDRPGRGWWTP